MASVALVEGRFPMSRVRDGFDRGVYTDLTEAGVFSLRADGFTWADAAVVYEELGRGLVPGPLVWSFGREHHRRWDRHRGPRCTMVEHADAIDEVVVLDADGVSVIAADAIEVTPVAWPLDPLTPVWRAERLPPGESSAITKPRRSSARRARCSRPRTAWAWPTGSRTSRSSTRRSASSSTGRSGRSRR